MFKASLLVVICASVLHLTSSAPLISKTHELDIFGKHVGGVSAIGDINSDGIEDVAVMLGGVGKSDLVTVYHGAKGGGAFTEASIAKGTVTRISRLSDMNADGFNDFTFGDGNKAFALFGNENTVGHKYPKSLRQIKMDTVQLVGDFQDHAGVGDFNADGSGDLAFLSTWNEDPALFVQLGHTEFETGRRMYFLSFLPEKKDPKRALILIGGLKNAKFASAGDVDNDGHSDVLVHSRENDAVFVVFGRQISRSTSGENRALNLTAVMNSEERTLLKGVMQLQSPARALHVPADQVVVSPAGDFNGDGFSDILISAPAASGPFHLQHPSSTNVSTNSSSNNHTPPQQEQRPQDATGAAAFCVVFGLHRPSAYGATPSERGSLLINLPKLSAHSSNQGFKVTASPGLIAQEVQSIPDLNGDNFDDILVLVRDNRIISSHQQEGSSEAGGEGRGGGGVYVIYGHGSVLRDFSLLDLVSGKGAIPADSGSRRGLQATDTAVGVINPIYFFAELLHAATTEGCYLASVGNAGDMNGDGCPDVYLVQNLKKTGKTKSLSILQPTCAPRAGDAAATAEEVQKRVKIPHGAAAEYKMTDTGYQYTSIHTRREETVLLIERSSSSSSSSNEDKDRPSSVVTAATLRGKINGVVAAPGSARITSRPGTFADTTAANAVKTSVAATTTTEITEKVRAAASPNATSPPPATKTAAPPTKQVLPSPLFVQKKDVQSVPPPVQQQAQHQQRLRGSDHTGTPQRLRGPAGTPQALLLRAATSRSYPASPSLSGHNNRGNPRN